MVRNLKREHCLLLFTHDLSGIHLVGRYNVKEEKKTWFNYELEFTQDKAATCITCSGNLHCVKSVQIRSFFWSVFSHIRSRKNSEFGPVVWSKIISYNFDYVKRIYYLEENWNIIIFDKNESTAAHIFHYGTIWWSHNTFFISKDIMYILATKYFEGSLITKFFW